MKKNPSVFISYSWDSEEHKKWVLGLVGLLRNNGVDATVDIFEIQKGTTNLHSMMVNNIKDKDYTVIVLTPEYAKKADELQGGVGFETSILIPFIQENLRKIIPIIYCKEDASKVIPFYLRGVHYIDFSAPNNFEDKFDELLHRIFEVDLINQPPLGKMPDLKPRKIEWPDRTTGGINNLIPSLREVTDVDKHNFIKTSFQEIKTGLIQLLEKTKGKNPNFDFVYEDITSRKVILKMYKNGHQKYAIKLWLGHSFGAKTETINLSYGNHISDSDNAMNEIISCEVGDDNTLKLKMILNVFGNKDAIEPHEIVLEIWRNVIPYLK